MLDFSLCTVLAHAYCIVCTYSTFPLLEVLPPYRLSYLSHILNMISVMLLQVTFLPTTVALWKIRRLPISLKRRNMSTGLVLMALHACRNEPSQGLHRGSRALFVEV